MTHCPYYHMLPAPLVRNEAGKVVLSNRKKSSCIANILHLSFTSITLWSPLSLLSPNHIPFLYHIIITVISLCGYVIFSSWLVVQARGKINDMQNKLILPIIVPWRWFGLIAERMINTTVLVCRGYPRYLPCMRTILDGTVPFERV